MYIVSTAEHWQSQRRDILSILAVLRKVMSDAPGENLYKRNKNRNCLSLKLILLAELYERSILMKLSVSPLWSTRSEVAKRAS